MVDFRIEFASSKIAMRVRAERPSWYPAVIGGALYKASMTSASVVLDYHISLVHSQVSLNITGSKYTKDMSPSKVILENLTSLVGFHCHFTWTVICLLIDRRTCLLQTTGEVMKIYMPLLSLASRVIHFKTSEGQAMQAGELIAKLDLDDPSAERKEASKHNCRL
ncbi:hypothetical protein ISN45_Aa02g010740 [Arabidopsis thaliana x Arabidopsis arenosa]|uniref:Uncharacterized protein n=1 Tax=Arabidopsis thaliana x Arabidopsis arenosa TaxID=1240361 RepID=A0A8T2BEF4_9BRAS|nr:hypothetical protein ISN45_Aa02g010740 [Arabidopsis thaliana x Arabidopsis arenosa]